MKKLNHINLDNIFVGVIGLGYVGIHLAIKFGEKRQVIGFDINKKRIKELKLGIDNTREFSKEEILNAKKITFTNDTNYLTEINCYIVAVPTPINKSKNPELKPLINATKMIGNFLKKNDIVIYESTVFPGATEEICVPILEEISGLKFNKDFFCGYSPERINPGDKKHQLTTIRKITSGSTSETANIVDFLYQEVITAGTYKAESIKVAEAAKVIENTQRDINIALINELSIIFNKMGIDTKEVLEAAGTKWNFLSFRPGLVGGHCIGVDPYYLTYKAESIGYKPEMILSGRRINDSMSSFVSTQLIKCMIKKAIKVNNSNILIMGLTFKANCPDIRNTRVINIVNELESYKCNIDLFDPWVDSELVLEEYNKSLIVYPKVSQYDAIIIAVDHDQFKEMGSNLIRSFGKNNCVIYDLKYVLKKDDSDLRL